MKLLDRLVVAFGVLDILHVCIAVVAMVSSLWGMTAEDMGGVYVIAIAVATALMFVYAGAYCLILASGIQLVRRKRSGVWLNYLLFPVRMVLRLPTFPPLFSLLPTSRFGYVMGIMAVTELIRVWVIYKWHRQGARNG